MLKPIFALTALTLALATSAAALAQDADPAAPEAPEAATAPAAPELPAGDAVVRSCAGLATPEACQCAAIALQEQVGEEDYALYEGISADYIDRMIAGEPRVDAWTAAVDAASAKAGRSSTAVMTRTNEIGFVHRAAITQCSG